MAKDNLTPTMHIWKPLQSDRKREKIVNTIRCNSDANDAAGNMEIISYDDFVTLFKQIMDFFPFRWQWRLFDRFQRGKLPTAIDLPTGLGKTSVMTIWLLARAFNTGLPRRLVYVVDRRAVVDQATAEAEKIRDRMQNQPECAEIAKRLGLDVDNSLPISTLRGKLADNRLWLEDPTRPAIIIGTVDMIGSRLLFSGYRSSRWIRPMQATLLAVDSIIVLDEAHLVPPFRRVLEFIACQRQQENPPFALPPLHILPLSATSRTSGEENIFGLTDEDKEDERLIPRLNATKRLIFYDIDGKLSDEMCDRAYAHDGKAVTVAIFCTGRNDAQKTAEALRKKLGNKREKDIRLLTGARRGDKRDELAESPTFKAFQGNYPEDGRTRYLVCTAAGEVGVDLDAQHAVMDLVPLERMVQRFGRVNRRGFFSSVSSIEVLLDASQFQKNKDDGSPVDLYSICDQLISLPGIDLCDWGLSPLAINKLICNCRCKSSNVLFWNLSPLAIDDMLKRLPLAKHPEVFSPEPPVPALDRAHFEAWSMTSLDQHPGRPEVAPFLRGITDDKPQTVVVWRADVTLLARLGGKKIEQAIENAPPLPAEILEEDTATLTTKLLKHIEYLCKEDESPGNLVALPLPIIVTKSDDIREIITVSKEGFKLRSGDFLSFHQKNLQQKLIEIFSYATIWLPCIFRGLDDDGLFAEKTQQSVNEPPRDSYSVLRLKVDLNTGAVDPLGQDWPDGIKPESGNREEIFRKNRWRRVFNGNLLLEDTTGDSEPGLALEYWAPPREARFIGDTDAAPIAQSLKEHQQLVEREIRRITDILLVPDWLTMLFTTAARYHDEGKKRDLWQHAMGADKEPAAIERPLAKTTNKGSGQIGGYRHEFGSVMDVLAHSDLLSLNEGHRDLVFHLIAAHHGRARPFIPTQDPDVIVPIVLEEKTLAAGLRFARLQRLWGPWGLAWLETLLRAADAMASKRSEE
jgi:CRISPR-associated endonuclease/helicase Cas3